MVCKSYTRRSSVRSTVTLYDKGDSYPYINRSAVESCTFENLTNATSIHRSKLNAVILRETPQYLNFATKDNCKCGGSNSDNKGSYIKFCNIDTSSVEDSDLRRSKIQDSTLISVAQIKWSEIRGSRIINSGSIKRCEIDETVLWNATGLRWSIVKKADLTDCSRIKRSTIQESTLKNSIVSHSSLSGCEVKDCAIYRTTFEDLILENGIWKHGTLVGRIDETKDVVIRQINGKTNKLQTKTGASDEVVNIPVEGNNSPTKHLSIPTSLNGKRTSGYRVDRGYLLEHSESEENFDTQLDEMRDLDAENDSKIPLPPYQS
ncbi:hypothetical protein BGW36DRAFT_94933 [Talaromyces proteolyticus]|uniref:Uncharacterized protein n=1 Tax=Talaromyces proteolyticus TaxID=1131652 RepID=A0AAD4L4E2_9EURO|nr:uncharacterized protein BGW36DRAFT_94933 [Talaromyces proteolyticus]KAH8704008.1 hypothetical protein BGW36DRAFT_94933 [Talaromyces proteolyticus]